MASSSVFTVAILGVGGRGGSTYGEIMHGMPDRFRIVALCDINQARLSYFADKLGVAADSLFTDEREFFKERLADVLIIATQDKDHYRHAVAAFTLGYDVLLEKPIATSREQMQHLLDLQKEHGCRALVCHVLRYAPSYIKVAELLRCGTVGRLVSINALENVEYGHMAHSYVRGAWRRSDTSSPMILAKCSHDLDLLQFFADAACDTVSSVGALTHFIPSEAPKGATERCLDCPHADTCAYSAKIYYVDRWHERGCPAEGFPFDSVAQAPVTEAGLTEGLRTGPYGRCVYACDNDVVDHQLTQLTFANGVRASLVMMGFTRHGFRRMEFFGTHGQITLDELADHIRIGVFGKPEQFIKISDLANTGGHHGGGDRGIVLSLYDVLSGRADSTTTLARSAESHFMAFAAEASREAGGTLVRVHE